PGTRESALLDPANTVQEAHAVLLAGGSAFGLEAAGGVVRYLEERGVGYDTGIAKVPIVPAAILFDLRVGGKPEVRPGADCGYRAAKRASSAPVQEGSVGAGAGATVGKLGAPDRAMRGGLGSAFAGQRDGLEVAALVAVNAVGDVVDPATGDVVAGTRTDDGRGLADARRLLRQGFAGRPIAGGNTTIGVVATNARLSKAQATKVARMAHDGIARAVYPAHTPYDGDTLFVLATGSLERPVTDADVLRLGALAADVVAESILRAVRLAQGIPGYPSVRDLESE
ncbi:MAG: peptidase S58 family protein, partial [Acidobacteria bacterium]